MIDFMKAEKHKIIYTGKELGKQSDWRRYRIVEVRTGHSYDNPTYEYVIEETEVDSYMSFLPRFLGGYWGFYYKMYWRTADLAPYNTHEEAILKCEDMLKWVLDHEATNARPITKEVISWHPDEIIK